MKHIAKLTVVAFAGLLGTATLAIAQAPPEGRADQSGGGAAEMKADKPAAAGPMDGTMSPSGGNRLVDQPGGQAVPMTNTEERKGGANAK